MQFRLKLKSSCGQGIENRLLDIKNIALSNYPPAVVAIASVHDTVSSARSMLTEITA
jgi:hypothetical protein